MTGQSSPAAWLRVTRGCPTPEELAVLTAVLLPRATATSPASPHPPATTWHPDLFEAPHSWHHHT